MSIDEHKALIRRYWQEASARGVLAVIDDYFAPDIVAHPPASASPAPLRGLDAWKQFTSVQWGAFPDLTGTVEEVIADEDRVAVRLTARGTHTGPLLGLPPTGTPVRFTGMEFFRIAEGKIVESWGQFDALSLLQQLGVMPGPAPTAGDAGGGTGSVSEPSGPATSTAENKRTARQYFEASKQTVFDAFLAPDYVLYLAGAPAPIRGPEGTKQLHGPYFSAFPDFRTPVDDVIGEGDRVAVRYTAHATHRGAFMGISPTGRQITMPGMSLLRVAGGTIAEEWALPDLLALMQQLGVIPVPGPAAG